MKKLAITTLAIFALSSCTENEMVKNYGGQAEIELQKNERLVNITFKESNLWMLTKFDSTQAPSIYFFKEKSSFGVMEGEYIIKEK